MLLITVFCDCSERILVRNRCRDVDTYMYYLRDIKHIVNCACYVHTFEQEESTMRESTVILVCVCVCV